MNFTYILQFYDKSYRNQINLIKFVWMIENFLKNEIKL